MKSFLMLLLASLLSFALCWSQEQGLILEDTDAFTKVEAPSIYRDRVDLGTRATAAFSITYESNFPLGEIRNPIDTATIIWGYMINSISQTPIKVKIRKDTLRERVIAQATLFRERRSSDTTWYPRALAKAQGWASAQFDTASDITITISTSYIDSNKFYIGCDGNTRSGKIDLLTTMMHELAHGLGFSSTFDVDSTTQLGKRATTATVWAAIRSVLHVRQLS